MDPAACPSASQLLQLLRDQLAEAPALALAQHLEVCPRCSQSLELLAGQTPTVANTLRCEEPPADEDAAMVTAMLRNLSKDNTSPGQPAQMPEAPAKGSSQQLPFLEPAAGPDEIGWLAHYRIFKVLGQGGMGLVLLAEDTQLQRPVALKVIKAEIGQNLVARQRLLREARGMAQVRSDHVVTIYQVGQANDICYIAMELLEGEPLESWLEQAPTPPLRETLRIGREIGLALAAAHARGLIHRDIKPANVWLEAPSRRVKVLDFGLARPQTADHKLTGTGIIVGTPAYMAPEQAFTETVDARADLFSLGCVLYEMVCGQLPFRGATTLALLKTLTEETPPPPSQHNPEVPPELDGLILCLLAKQPADRPGSAQVVVARLQAIERLLPLSVAQPVFPDSTAVPGEGVEGEDLPVPLLSGPKLAPETRPRQRRLTLGSEIQSVPATPVAAPSGPPAPGKRLISWASAGLLLLGLLELTIFLWRPWQQTSASSASGPALVPPRGEPVKVGVLHSLSGTMANSEAVVVDAVLFALEEVNQEGGVLGRPVKPVVADGRSDGPTFAREAERLITREKVNTIFGCWTSASRKTVKPIFEEHDHLLIYPVQFEGLETSPCILYLGAAPNQQILPAVQWAVTALQKKRFFLVGNDYVFPRAANAIIKDHLQRTGAQVVGEEYVPLGCQQVEAVVRAIVRAKPDLILNTCNGDSNTAFFRALRAAGITPATTPTLSFSVGEQELRSLSLADLEGDYAAWTYFQSVATAENEDFVRRFQDKYPQRSITDPMETAYVGVKLWARAINEAQSLEPKKIRRALLNQRLKGPAGEVRIDPDTQYCFRTPRIGQVQADGQFKIVWTAPEPVRPEPYPNSRTAEAWGALLHDLYTGWGQRWAAPEADHSGAKVPVK